VALVEKADCVFAKHEQIAELGKDFPFHMFALLIQLVGPQIDMAGACNVINHL
jgi:hypothetical protein